MDEEVKRWEEGARTYLERRREPTERPEREGYFTAGRLFMLWQLRPGRNRRGWAPRLALRLVALWLEHLASELQEEAVAHNAIADHTGADRLMDEAKAHLTSAKAIRVRLLGEEVTDAG